jgi:hypothetical protein
MKEDFMQRVRTKMIMGLGIFLLVAIIGSSFSGNALAGPYYLPLIFNPDPRGNLIGTPTVIGGTQTVAQA